MNWGWYIVYLLMCIANGIMCNIHGFSIDGWQFWVWTGIVGLTFVAGASYRRKEDCLMGYAFFEAALLATGFWVLLFLVGSLFMFGMAVLWFWVMGSLRPSYKKGE